MTPNMGSFFFSQKWLIDGLILDHFPLRQVAKCVHESTLNGLTQIATGILVSLVMVAFNDAITQLIHHLP